MSLAEPETPEQVIERVFKAHGQRLYELAYRITGSQADAEDVVQNVFVGLPRALSSFRGEGSFDGWLRRITLRTALMHMRSNKRRAESDLTTSMPLAETSGDPLNHIAYHEALRTLSLEQRTVFVLHEIEGYSHEEIAQILNITPGASAVRLLRARGSLRIQLGDV